MADYKRNDGANSFMSFLMGAAAGALATFLSRRENREKVRHKVEEFKEKGQEWADEAEIRAREMEKEAGKGVREIGKKLEKDAERRRSTTRIEEEE